MLVKCKRGQTKVRPAIERMLETAKKAANEENDASTAMGTGFSGEIAEAWAFLIGGHTGLINGIDLLIDGGTIAAMRTEPYATGE